MAGLDLNRRAGYSCVRQVRPGASEGLAGTMYMHLCGNEMAEDE
jgi:hypothetical protein